MEKRAPDAAVAQAIDRVLATERDAAAAIEQARREAEAVIEAARAERRRLLEAARQRSSRLHAAGQLRLQRVLARLEQHGTEPGADPAALQELTRLAVMRLARRLAADVDERA